MAKKRIFKIQWQLLFIIIPVSVLPMLIIVSFTLQRIFGHLNDQTYRYYKTLVRQVTSNMDFVYDQYARSFYNMLEKPEVKDGLLSPPYRNKTEEFNISKQIIGDKTLETGLRKTLEEKIEGACHIYELDRHSLIDDSDYTMHLVFEENIDMHVEFKKVLEDPLYINVIDSNKNPMIFGMFQDGILKGRSRETPVFLYKINYPDLNFEIGVSCTNPPKGKTSSIIV